MSKKKIKDKKKGKKVSARKQRSVAKTTSFWKQPALLVPILAILVFTAIVFSPSLSNDFVNWDDDVNIMENENLGDFSMESIKKIFHPETGRVIGNYNPLPIFTFLIDKELLGGYDGQNWNAKPFHVNNLILHLICILLVYRIMLLLNLSRNAAIIAALLFAIHPMRVESVAWVTERKDVLLGAFYFAAIISYIKFLKAAADKKRFYSILTLVLFVFALFSKIQAVALPLSMLALDYYFKREMNMKRVIEKWPYFALSLLFGLSGVFFLVDQGSLAVTDDTITNYSFIHRLAIGAFSYCIYLIKLIVPYELAPMYPYPSQLLWYYWASAIPVIGLAFLFFKWMKEGRRAVVFGIAFFTFNVMFLLQIVGAGQGFKADRFTYIPYMGLFFLIAYGYDWYTKKRPDHQIIVTGILGLVLAVYSFMSFQQCKIWKDGEVMWTHVMKYYPGSPLPWGNRAHHLRELGNYERAEADYKQAIKVQPSAALHNSLGKTYFDSRRATEAIPHYNKAIEMDPTKSEFYANRGAAHGSLNQLNMALADLSKAIELDNDHSNSYLNRSLVYSSSGQNEAALSDIQNYLRLKPNDASMWYEKGTTLMRLQRYDESLTAFNNAIQRNNTNGVFYLERGNLHLNQNNKAAALSDFKAAQARGTQVPADLMQRAR